MSIRARIERLAQLVGDPSEKCSCGFLVWLREGDPAPAVCPQCGRPDPQCGEIVEVIVNTREEAAQAVAAMKEAADNVN